jgi:hypothetical protein
VKTPVDGVTETGFGIRDVILSKTFSTISLESELFFKGTSFLLSW